ncbi:hypothetical protein EDE15_4203 [Edaphobacter aggregans]|uniref:Uncharacterized protein n=1 Tax=Edaphobacter aggregans TaxID=570835 RepID=A0A428MPE3_9BACT|nr:hypothetical protein [Edaphobacter aggregans]RSL18613.1 hypothetical protein EDE15_4203 [Edaphobacter aggregans]
MTDLQSLTLDGLHERHPGLTQALGQTYCEAASVCFSRHHQPPVTVSLKHGETQQLRFLNFLVPDVRVRNANANEIDATEAAAYGVSLAAVEAVAGLVAVRRAETLTGADWYVAPEGTGADDLEDCIRLEVSGISGGGSSDVVRRLQEKVAQTARGKSNLPAMASVVGFKVLEVAISPLGAGA